MSAPISYASHALNLEKNPSMPVQHRPKTAKPKPAAPAAEVKSPEAVKKAPAAAAKKPAAADSSAAAGAAPASARKEKPVSSSPDASPSPTGDDDVAPLEFGKPRAPPKPRTYHTGFAMVKEVLSGDSLKLAGSASGDVNAPERQITLTGVQAPKFGRGKNQVDEPFAWESREYLRKHVIGQQVQFIVQHTDDKSGRDYGVVTLKGTDIAQQMIKAGWVTVKTGPGGKDGKIHPEKEALLAIETEAAARGLGVHRKGANPRDHLRTIDWTPDAQALYAANKSTPLPAVVDQVRDGSTLRLELIHPSNPMKHSIITLYLAGVSCPRTPLPASVINAQQAEHARKVKEENFKGQAPSKPKAEPFAMEAQAFTEARLLNRDVQVLLQGVDKTGNLFGTIAFAKGNISEKLLEQGFGKLVPWSAALSPDAAKLKAAEAKAKSQKLRLWSSWSAEKEAASAAGAASGVAAAEFQGKVVGIPSADSITVEDGEGKEVRVWLASVRAPRLATRAQKDGKDEAYAQEAREFLRSKLIGQKVRVVPEYVRASQEEDDKRPARQLATIFQNKVNVNEALIASGFAEAMQHRMDEERSQFYDQYLAAEQKAKEAGRGKWDAKEHQVTRVTDLTDRPRLPRAKPARAAKKEDGEEADAEEESEKKSAPAAAPAAPSKADQEAATKSKALIAKSQFYMSAFKREKQVSAVVEFVFSASRVKLLVPKENVLISFSLAGIRTPATKGDDASPLAEEILQYVRSKITQHSVKIEVETTDKAGNFLGSLFHNRQNLAVDLLNQGYASIFGFSAAKNPYAKELYAAERAAKEAHKGIWKDWVEPTPEEKAAMGNSYGRDDEEESKDDKSAGQERVARITEIVDAGDFWVQFVGDKNAETIEKALAAVAEQVVGDDFVFNRPESSNGRAFIAAGQFGDDSWHRVRCDGQDANGDWNVCFIDFGNHDTLLGDRLRHLPAEAAKIPPMAVHCALAGLTAPKAPEYQEGSALAFSEMAFGVDLKCMTEFSDKFGRKHVTLSHESHPISVNRQLLRDGWAKVQARPDRRIQRLVNELAEEEKYAKDHHYNIFEYGDVSEDEEGAEKVLGPDPKARAPRGKPAQTGKAPAK